MERVEHSLMCIEREREQSKSRPNNKSVEMENNDILLLKTARNTIARNESDLLWCLMKEKLHHL